ncbi:mitogen-activated protein kinase kinase kinase [Trifolium repens]|nr:mitogen-activated protein kinase kinase kinase [Trifolium repens]
MNHPFSSKRNSGIYRPYSNVDSFLKIQITMDNDENLAEMFLDIFYYHLYVNDLTIYEALARRATIGHIAGVDVGVEFMSRIEMYLISFHDYEDGDEDEEAE